MDNLKQPPLPNFLDDVFISTSSPNTLNDMESKPETFEVPVSAHQLILPGFEEIMGEKLPSNNQEKTNEREKRRWRVTTIAVASYSTLPELVTTPDA